MPKRIKQRKRPTEESQLTHFPIDASTETAEPGLPSQKQISLLMTELGRRGGQVGGKRRLVTMSSEERRNVAKKAAKARWKRTKK